MGVTFTAESGAVVGYVITCGCRGATALAPRYGSDRDALADLRVAERLVEAGMVARMVLPGCELPDVCPDYQLMIGVIEDVERPEITVHLGNAALLLGALGYQVDEYGYGSGQAEPDEFLGRVLTALGLAPRDEGTPARTLIPGEVATSPLLAALVGSGGATVHAGARPPGYLQDQLSRLHDLAEWCREHGRRVQWA